MFDGATPGIERVETPERVELSLDLAGVGSRAAAALLDYLVCFSILLVVGLVLALTSFVIGAWAIAVLLLAAFFVQWFYFASFEALRGGQTPGKRALSLRVQKIGGYPIGWSEALIRNLLRPVDSLFAYGVGMITMLLTARSQRIGDLAAGTIVVRERSWSGIRLEGLGYAGPAFSDAAAAGAGVDLTAPEFEVLHEFVSRSSELEPHARVRIAWSMAERLRARLEKRGAFHESWASLGPEAFLHALDDAFRGEARGGSRGESRSDDLLPTTRSLIDS